MGFDETLRTGIALWFAQARILLDLIVIAWIVSIINFGFLGGALIQFGLKPRTANGLLGILLSPFLHGDWGHLEGNTLSFFVLGGLIVLKNPEDFIVVTVTILALTGTAIWFLGSDLYYIGASGITFGYMGFLILRGYVERDISSVLISILVIFFRSWRLLGVLPLQEGVAWDGHLFGVISGLLTARYLPLFQSILGQAQQLFNSKI